MTKSWDYNQILIDRNLFNSTVYTPLSEAIKILDNRQKDIVLIEKIEKLLNDNIPEPLKNIGKNACFFRQVATPNFEARWFLEISSDQKLNPIFFEYHSDKFVDNNFYKRTLGQLLIHREKNNKKGEKLEEKITIIDFNKYKGKPFINIKTFWLESLIDFHKKLFNVYGYKSENINFWDNSAWFIKNGANADNYYTNLMMLFICHGILFENFILSDEDGDFTKNIFLPALEKVYNTTGLKPLIVPIPPMDKEIEEDSHWHSHEEIIKKLIK